jgi:hypothetical protein
MCAVVDAATYVTPGRLGVEVPPPAAIQSGLLRWANSILNSDGIEIGALPDSVRSGVSLLQLTEHLIGRDIGATWLREPASLREAQSNVSKLLLFLSINNIIETDIITDNDIIAGEPRFVFYVLRSIYHELRNGPPADLALLDSALVADDADILPEVVAYNDISSQALFCDVPPASGA